MDCPCNLCDCLYVILLFWPQNDGGKKGVRFEKDAHLLELVLVHLLYHRWFKDQMKCFMFVRCMWWCLGWCLWDVYVVIFGVMGWDCDELFGDMVEMWGYRKSHFKSLFIFHFLLFQEHFELFLISCIMSQIGHWRILYVDQHQRHMDLVLDKLIWCWFGRWMSEMISYLLSLISRSNRPMDWVIHLFQDPRIGRYSVYCFEKKTSHLPPLVFKIKEMREDWWLIIEIWFLILKLSYSLSQISTLHNL